MSLTVNDTAPALSGTCLDDKTPADLTGATLAVHIRRPDKTVLTKAGTLGGDPTDGTWTAAWVAGDLNEDGNWKAEVQATFANGKIQTFGPANFYVRPEIA